MDLCQIQSNLRKFFLWFYNFCNSPSFRNYQIYRCECLFCFPFPVSTPVVLQLEFTNLCNLSCLSCAHSHWACETNPPSFLHINTLKKIDSWYRNASEIVIGGYGEPLMHPQFQEILNWLCRDSFKKVSMITNGILLPEKRPDLSKISKLLLSVDGVGRVYSMHRHISFEKIQRSLYWLFENYPDINVELHMVWNQDTHNNLEEYLQFAKLFKIRKIHLLPERMYSLSRESAFLFYPEKIHGIYRKLQQLQSKYDISLHYPDMSGRVMTCNQPLESAFILADGEILACCASVFKKNPWRFSLGEVSGLNFGRDFRHLAKLIRFRLSRFFSFPWMNPCLNCSFRRISKETLSHYLNEKREFDE